MSGVYEVKMKTANRRYDFFRAAICGLLLAGGLTLQFSCRAKKEVPQRPQMPARAVKLGIEVLLESRLDLIKGKKVGLITNPTGVNGRLRSALDLLREAGQVGRAALFGP